MELTPSSAIPYALTKQAIQGIVTVTFTYSVLEL